MYIVKSNIARKKQAEAKAGIRALPPISQMSVGDGGLDEEGNVIRPLAEDMQLRHELLRRPYDRCEKLSEYSYDYILKLGRDELINKQISEMALFDAEGDIVILSTFNRKDKDSEVEMDFELIDEN